MKAKDALVAMLRAQDKALREAGFKVAAGKHIDRLEALLDSGRDLDVAVASIFAMVSMTRPVAFEILASEISGHSIKAKRYLELEDSTGGKKRAMADAMKVSTQALHEYEKKNAAQLALLRAWVDEQRVLEIMMTPHQPGS